MIAKKGMAFLYRLYLHLCEIVGLPLTAVTGAAQVAHPRPQQSCLAPWIALKLNKSVATADMK